ncbi:MAG: hypothetical protein V1850_06320 [Candidatus Bathyarchaeota archaeon]
MIIDSGKVDNVVILDIAKLMVVAARTAPKARGEDKIKTAIITGEDKEKLAKVMEEREHSRCKISVTQVRLYYLALSVELQVMNGLTFKLN